MSPFVTLESLKKTVSGARADLKEVRKINAHLQEQTKAAFDRERFTIDYSRRTVTALREEASEGAKLYLEAERTFANLISVSEQQDHWNVSAYLRRASAVSDPGALGGGSDSASLRTIVSLLRVQNAQQATQRMSTASLGEAAASALARSEWQTLGVVFSEIIFRSQRDDNDSVARVLVAQIGNFTIPDLVEAKSLIVEGGQIQSHLDYTLRSIREGTADVGLQMERLSEIQRAANGDKALMRAEIQRDREEARTQTA